MKRLLVLALTIGLIAGGMTSADAAKKKKKPKRISRVVEGTYDLPPLVIAGTCSQSGAIGCVSFATGPKESFITKASITDQHGQPVSVSISANTDGEIGDDVSYGAFCGELTEPISFDPGVELHFWVGAAIDISPSCAPGAATSGTVTATLSNLP